MTLLALQNIKKYFPVKKNFVGKTTEQVRAVDDVSLQVRAGEHVGIVGESGSGKTTLGRIMVRLLKEDAGTLSWEGQQIQSLSDRQLKPYRKHFQMIFQDPMSSLDPRFTIDAILEEAFNLLPEVFADERRVRKTDVLTAVGLPEKVLARFPHEFSGGERQRIAIARSLLVRPKLLILDEAVSSLDMLVQAQILDLLNSIEKKYALTYVFISHNLKVIRKICKRTVVMYRGKIVEAAGTERLFAGPRHTYTQGLLEAAINYQVSATSGDILLPENGQLKEVAPEHLVYT